MTDTTIDTARALLGLARAATPGPRAGSEYDDPDAAFIAAANPAAVAALCERLLALGELLGVLQWEGGIVGGNCIRCGRHIRAGHAPDCELAALLAAGRGGEGGG